MEEGLEIGSEIEVLVRKIILVSVVAVLLFSSLGVVYSEEKLDLEELVLVTGGMEVDWIYDLPESVSGKITGKLLHDSSTDKQIWAGQGCINDYCFMDEGGPVSELDDEDITCHLRVFIPSELEIGSVASLGMDVFHNGKEFYNSKLHLLSIQPIEANFTMDKEVVRIKEKATTGCIPMETTSEEKIVSPAAPQIRNGRMMIPFRLLGEVIGAEVSWNATTQEASYQLGPKRVILKKGIPTARIIMTSTDSKVEMETAPDIINGSTMIPLRFVTDILGGDVTWDDPTKTAIINFPGCGGK